jgi:hypothetical protein
MYYSQYKKGLFDFDLNVSFKSSTLGVAAAVQHVRDKNKQAENEDALKLSLKDQVDDKVIYI